MKYALFVYDRTSSWNDLPPSEQRALHDSDLYREINSGALRLLAHYRLRSPHLTTSIRLDGEEVIRTEGPTTPTGETLRALFLLESDEADAVLELAEQLPAIRFGGSVEVWPLIEPDPHGRRRHGGRSWRGRHRAA